LTSTVSQRYSQNSLILTKNKKNRTKGAEYSAPY
jgi:hypothetical protein